MNRDNITAIVDAIIAAARCGAVGAERHEPVEQPIIESDCYFKAWKAVFDTLGEVSNEIITKDECSQDWACRIIRECFAERDTLRARVVELETIIGTMDLIPDQPDPDDWIPWHGGECPVEKGTVGDYKLREGGIHTSVELGGRCWKHISIGSDITAYRITPQERPTQAEIMQAYREAGIVPEKWPWLIMTNRNEWFACKGEDPVQSGDAWVCDAPLAPITLPPVADWKTSKRRVVP